MKQTAVEWLENKCSEFETIYDSLPSRLYEYIQQAKEMERQQQGYNVEDLECAWNSSNQNMRFQFSSSAYKPITFKQWLEVFKKVK